MVDGFLVRQNRLATPGLLAANQPYAFYHSYERCNDRAKNPTQNPAGPWTWTDAYISPEAQGKIFFGGDPIENIRTNLGDNQPQLLYPVLYPDPVKSTFNRQWGTSQAVGGTQVLFFINRHGQIIVCPDPGVHRTKLVITSLVEALQVADAVDGIDWEK